MHQSPLLPSLDPMTVAWIEQEAQRTATPVELVIRHLIYLGLAAAQTQPDQMTASPPMPASNSVALMALAGTWTAEQAAEFEDAVAVFGQIDEALW